MLLADDDYNDDTYDPVDLPRPRVIHRRINYYLNDSIFRQSFRLDREVIDQLENLIGRHLVDTNRNRALAPRQQILTALHFMGNGCQYHVNGQTHGISKSTVCRCLHRVCSIIAHYVMPMFVKWPRVSYAMERQFFQIAGFPHVKGVVDGTLIHIDAPSTDEPAYVGRDNKHSINAVIVSGPQNQILFVSAKSPGSFHDSRALRVSNVWASWEEHGWRPDNDNNSIILGDSAYPLTNWLIPPTVRTANIGNRRLEPAIELFLQTHRKTRFIVERTIGILKEEFPCLNHMRVKTPARISTIIYATVTLHNMQNHYRRGSYEYDPILNRIANERPNEDLPNRDNITDCYNVEVDAIARQRNLILYFNDILEQN